MILVLAALVWIAIEVRSFRKAFRHVAGEVTERRSERRQEDRFPFP